MEAGEGRRAVMRAAWAYWAAVALVLAVFALQAVVPLTSAAVRAEVFDGWLYSGLLVAASLGTVARGVLLRQDRLAWLLIGAGCVAWTAGDLYWWRVLSEMEEPPVPSVADGLYLAFHPLAYAGLVLLLRGRVQGVRVAQWLDGVAGALCIAAVGAALVLPPVLAAAEGSAAAVAVNLAYPLADLLVLALLAGMLVLTGGRPGGGWAGMAAGCAVFAVADAVYLYRVATDSYTEGTVTDALWPAALVLIGVAAWCPPRAGRARAATGLAVMVVPAAITAAALAVLVADHYTVGTGISVWCAAGALTVCLVRGALTYRENVALAGSHQQAVTDPLTGLPNRRLLRDRVAQALLRARRTGETVAVMIIDLDDFKDVNDTLGHHAGDELLTLLAGRLRSALRAGDTVARLGGDEFAVLLPSVADEAAARGVAAALHAAIAEPVALAGLTLDTHASIGIALFPDHADDGDGLLQRADVAMYQAKAQHLGHEVYRPEDDVHSPERLGLVGELRRALEDGELVLHYQPKVDLASGLPAGVEALVRWQHPVRGLLPPGEFIPLAEHTTLIAPLTLHVMDQALAQARRWDAEGTPVAVSVNVSVRNLLDGAFPDHVASLLARHGVPAARLELEITETVLMANPARAMEILARLHALGVHLAIDDFGVGYSSLDYLKRLPVDVIKIDRSFVMHMATDPADAMIVRSTIDLARNLGLRVVAEGVEDAASLETLRGLGCHAAQGYHLGRPAPAAALRLGAPVAESAPA